MTTEEDFQRALDANPNDHQTRLVFADWLQEHNDPRAEGYRALGTQQLTPVLWRENTHDRVTPPNAEWTHVNNDWARGIHPNSLLPTDWHEALRGFALGNPPTRRNDRNWVAHHTRRASEDAAAHAFSHLPPQRRSALLGQQSEGDVPKPNPEQLTRRRLARRKYGK